MIVYIGEYSDVYAIGFLHDAGIKLQKIEVDVDHSIVLK